MYEVDGHYNIDAWSFGFGISADLFTGGWETEYTDLSLFDFGHSEANFEISNDGFNIGAMASIWNPSLEFSVWGVTLEIGAAVGSVGIGGKKEANSIEYKIGLGTGGFFKISW